MSVPDCVPVSISLDIKGWSVGLGLLPFLIALTCLQKTFGYLVSVFGCVPVYFSLGAKGWSVGLGLWPFLVVLTCF